MTVKLEETRLISIVSLPIKIVVVVVVVQEILIKKNFMSKNFRPKSVGSKNNCGKKIWVPKNCEYKNLGKIIWL